MNWDQNLYLDITIYSRNIRILQLNGILMKTYPKHLLILRIVATQNTSGFVLGDISTMLRLIVEQTRNLGVSIAQTKPFLSVLMIYPQHIQK